MKIIYAAVGDGAARAQRQFRVSYAHLRKVYAGPVTVVSDLSSGWPADGCDVVKFEHDLPGYGCKTVLPHYAGDAERVLFLDCDVVPVAPFDELWTLPDDVTFAVAPDLLQTVGRAAAGDAKEGRWPLEELDATVREVGPHSRYFNTGVIYWRPARRVEYLFMIWRREWLRWRGPDQFSLMRAMHHMRFHPHVLDRRYNTWGGAYRTVEEAARRGVTFAHYWLGTPMPAVPAPAEPGRDEARPASRPPRTSEY